MIYGILLYVLNIIVCFMMDILWKVHGEGTNLIGKSEGMFCKRENIGLVLKRSIGFGLEEKGRSQKYFGIANILRLE